MMAIVDDYAAIARAMRRNAWKANKMVLSRLAPFAVERAS